MSKIITLFIAITIFVGCKKSDEKTSISECVAEMVNRYENELKCSKQGEMETNLYSGLYKNKTVYFSNIMCINCNSIPPQFGYECSGKKIEFSNFQDVINIKKVYDSCSKEIIEY